MNRTSSRLRWKNRTNQSVGRWALSLGLVGMAIPPAAGEEPDPGSFPPPPSMTLAPIDGIHDVDAYTSSVADRATRLVELAENTKDPLRRAELQLTAANLILAQQIEPACTRTIWGLTALPEHPVDTRKLTAALDSAQRLLDGAWSNITDARAALRKDKPDAEGTASETADRLMEEAARRDAEGDKGGPKHEPEAQEPQKGEEKAIDPTLARISATSAHQRTLEAFRKAVSTALLPPGDDRENRARRRAASELAVLVENDDRRIATAAGFWQAYLRKGETDPHASLAGLDYALDDIAPAEQPYAFFSRVMRCDILAGHGQVVAALTLLTQMEERALTWYPDEEPRTQALSAIAWTKLHTLRTWHDTLDPNDGAEERAWCSAQAATLVKNAFGEPRALPRLSPAIPLLLAADAVEAGAAADNDVSP